MLFASSVKTVSLRKEPSLKELLDMVNRRGKFYSGGKSTLQLVVEQNFPPEKWLYNRSSPGESLL